MVLYTGCVYVSACVCGCMSWTKSCFEDDVHDYLRPYSTQRVRNVFLILLTGDSEIKSDSYIVTSLIRVELGHSWNNLLLLSVCWRSLVVWLIIQVGQWIFFGKYHVWWFTWLGMAGVNVGLCDSGASSSNCFLPVLDDGMVILSRQTPRPR